MTQPFDSIATLVLAAALAAGAGGCALVRPEKPEPPHRFVLESPPASQAGGAGPVLLIAMPTARPGYDTPRMVYVTRSHELQAFARSEWADSPARMLAPLLVQSLGGVAQPILAPSPASAALRLDTEIVTLQHEFGETPSRVRFGLRAQLTDLSSRQLVATTGLEAVEPAPSDDPYGGVVAANRAVDRVLAELTAWVRASIP